MESQSRPGFDKSEEVSRVAPTDASVLIEGETGVGKELVAREIHRSSSRSDKPIVRVNCAAIPKELFESEFFGHARGSFSGATRNRAGRFAAADEGTLFLDEVGEIPVDLQGKLLRVLQDGEYTRVGEEKPRHANVRIVAATNEDIDQLVRDKKFRSDLLFRLRVFPIRVPTLRERKEDIHLLISSYLATHHPSRSFVLEPDDAIRLRERQWPGNIRELHNALERAVILSQQGKLRFHDRDLVSAALELPRVLTDEEIREIERRNILAALEQCGWKISGSTGAADCLGLPASTLESRMRRLGISRPG